MKKKSIAARLGVAAMALTLVTTSLSSGTLAKYTSTVSATTTLEVANWNVLAEITNKDGSKTTAMKSGTTVDDMVLASTAYTTGDHAVVDGNVKAGKLAPGMAGEFNVDLYSAGKATNSATDVDVEYKVYIKPLNGSGLGNPPSNFVMWDNKTSTETTPLQLSGSPTSTEYGFKLSEGRFEAGATSTDAKKTVTISWKWPYETAGNTSSEDQQDTDNGEANAKTVKYQVFVIFTQANPTQAAGA